MERFPGLTTSALALAAALAGGCGDDPLAPPGAALPPPDVSQPLGLSDEDQASLRASFLFVSQQSVRGLQQAGPAQLVATAFATLVGHVEANDRVGTERAMAAARLAISRYRVLGHDGGAAADLEAMDLTLLRAAALVAEASSHPTTIDQERQP